MGIEKENAKGFSTIFFRDVNRRGGNGVPEDSPGPGYVWCQLFSGVTVI